jgi:multidrug resistance efflux pump
MSEIKDSTISEPGKESLIYTPTKVSWAVNSFILENSSKTERLFLGSLILFSLFFLLWGIFTFKAIIVQASGVFISAAPPVPIVAEKSYTISKVLVKDGMRVKKGDILISEKSPSFEKDVQEIISQLAIISKNLNSMRSDTCDASCKNSTRFILDNPITSSPLLLKDPSLKQEILMLENALKGLGSRLEEQSNLESALRSSSIRMSSVNKKIAEIEKRNATSILNVEYEQLKNELSDIEDQVKEKKSYAKLALNSALDIVDVSLKKLPVTVDLFIAQSDLVAPVPGIIVFDEFRGVGQTVGAGQILFKILPNENSIIAKIDVKNQEISKIKSGQVVKFEIEAYPSTEYGIQEGLIDYIPVKDANDKDPNYKVIAKLKNQKIINNGKEFEISPGMKTTTKILIGKERTIMFFLKKVFKLKNDLFGE